MAVQRGRRPNRAAFFLRLERAVVKPVLQALVLAEKVYEVIDGRKVITGTFNQVIYSLPTKDEPEAEPNKPHKVQGGTDAGCPSAYISLTDIQGSVEIVLRYVDLLENEVLLQTSVTVKSNDRLATKELIVPLPKLPAPHPGTYAFEVLCDNELLGSHRIHVEIQGLNKDNIQ